MPSLLKHKVHDLLTEIISMCNLRTTSACQSAGVTTMEGSLKDGKVTFLRSESVTFMYVLMLYAVRSYAFLRSVFLIVLYLTCFLYHCQGCWIFISRLPAELRQVPTPTTSLDNINLKDSGNAL